jgi:hypothetical protein
LMMKCGRISLIDRFWVIHKHILWDEDTHKGRPYCLR